MSNPCIVQFIHPFHPHCWEDYPDSTWHHIHFRLYKWTEDMITGVWDWKLIGNDTTQADKVWLLNSPGWYRSEKTCNCEPCPWVGWISVIHKNITESDFCNPPQCMTGCACNLPPIRDETFKNGNYNIRRRNNEDPWNIQQSSKLFELKTPNVSL